MEPAVAAPKTNKTIIMSRENEATFRMLTVEQVLELIEDSPMFSPTFKKKMTEHQLTGEMISAIGNTNCFCLFAACSEASLSSRRCFASFSRLVVTISIMLFMNSFLASLNCCCSRGPTICFTWCVIYSTKLFVSMIGSVGTLHHHWTALWQNRGCHCRSCLSWFTANSYLCEEVVASFWRHGGDCCDLNGLWKLV